MLSTRDLRARMTKDLIEDLLREDISKLRQREREARIVLSNLLTQAAEVIIDTEGERKRLEERNKELLVTLTEAAALLEGLLLIKNDLGLSEEIWGGDL